MEKLGGRKFVLTLLCVGVGTAIELYTARGVSAEFAGLLAALVAAFGAANAWNTKQYLDSRPETTVEAAPIDTSAIEMQIDELRAQIDSANDTATKAGQAVLQMSQQVAALKNIAAIAAKVK